MTHRHNIMSRRERLALHNRLVVLRQAIKSNDPVAIHDARDEVLPGKYLGVGFDAYGPRVITTALAKMLDRIGWQAWQDIQDRGLA